MKLNHCFHDLNAFEARRPRLTVSESGGHNRHQHFPSYRWFIPFFFSSEVCFNIRITICGHILWYVHHKIVLILWEFMKRLSKVVSENIVIIYSDYIEILCCFDDDLANFISFEAIFMLYLTLEEPKTGRRMRLVINGQIFSSSLYSLNCWRAIPFKKGEKLMNQTIIMYLEAL